MNNEIESAWVQAVEEVYDRSVKDIFILGWFAREKEVEILREKILELEKQLRMYTSGR